MIFDIDPSTLLALLATLTVAGMVKGATGAGTPIVAIPVLTALFDVRIAVAFMVAPNLATNLWQMVEHRRARLPGRFSLVFALAGGGGVIFGTWFLLNLPVAALSYLVAGTIMTYIAMRLLHPRIAIPFPVAEKLAFPVGAAAGLLQGAAGISTPIAATFMNAMQLERATFIATISAFFGVMSVMQAALLMYQGTLDIRVLSLSIIGLVPLLLGMALGSWLARHMSARTFDRVILVLLAVVATSLVVEQIALALSSQTSAAQ